MSEVLMSGFAEPIGDLYSEDYLLNRLEITTVRLSFLAINNEVFRIASTEGDKLYPAPQITDKGLLPGVSSVVTPLKPFVDEYMLAVWLNSSKEYLDNLSPWQELTDNEGPTNRLLIAVKDFAKRMRQ